MNICRNTGRFGECFQQFISLMSVCFIHPFHCQKNKPIYTYIYVYIYIPSPLFIALSIFKQLSSTVFFVSSDLGFGKNSTKATQNTPFMYKTKAKNTFAFTLYVHCTVNPPKKHNKTSILSLCINLQTYVHKGLLLNISYASTGR